MKTASPAKVDARRSAVRMKVIKLYAATVLVSLSELTGRTHAINSRAFIVRAVAIWRVRTNAWPVGLEKPICKLGGQSELVRAAGEDLRVCMRQLARFEGSLGLQRM